ncbi:aconitase A [Pseudomonas oryzihabitans]
MGIFPVRFPAGQTAEALALSGEERLDFAGLDELQVRINPITLEITHRHGRQAGRQDSVALELPLDSSQEILYLRQGDILPYVIRKALGDSDA